MLELLKRIDRSKYAFTCVFYDDYRKGDGTSIGEELARLGIDFVRLPRRAQPIVVKFIKELVRALFFFSRRLRRLGVFFVEFQFRIRPDARRIADILRDRRADLVYLNNQPSSNLEGILAARAAGLPAIQHSRIDVTLNSIEVNIANDGLCRIICVSDGVRQSLVRQGVNAANCVVVHNGIDARTRPSQPAAEVRAAWGIGGDEFLIGTVGSLVRRKRVSDLIEAVAALATKERNSIKCLIVGSGPEQSSLAAVAERLNVSDRIVFTGFQADPVSITNALDIFVLPSTQEGLPRVILEAMLMAKAVVASNVIGPAELVVDGETGFLLSPGDIDSWINALRRLINDATLRKRMGEAGRRRVLEKFLIERYVAGVCAIFDQILPSNVRTSQYH